MFVIRQYDQNEMLKFFGSFPRLWNQLWSSTEMD